MKKPVEILKSLLLMIPLTALIVSVFLLFWTHPEQGGREILLFFGEIIVLMAITLLFVFLFQKGIQKFIRTAKG